MEIQTFRANQARESDLKEGQEKEANPKIEKFVNEEVSQGGNEEGEKHGRTKQAEIGKDGGQKPQQVVFESKCHL